MKLVCKDAVGDVDEGGEVSMLKVASKVTSKKLTGTKSKYQ